MAKSRTPAALSRRTFLARSATTVGALAGVGALLDACGTSAAGSSTINIMGNTSETTKAILAAYQQANPHVTIK